MQEGFIKYIIIIVVILILVFLSQKPDFKIFDKNLLSKVFTTAQNYWAKGLNWVQDKAYPNISGEVQKRGDILKEGINQEKEKVSESIGEKIKNYFSGLVDSVIHPASQPPQ